MYDVNLISFQYACRSQPAHVIKLLVDAKANMQARNNGTGRVPLHEAAEKGNQGAVQQLLELGAPYMPRTTFGELPIDFAREASQTTVTAFLGNTFVLIPCTLLD